VFDIQVKSDMIILSSTKGDTSNEPHPAPLHGASKALRAPR
jgi:hypothetical protein